MIEAEASRRYVVVVNDEEQHSIWLHDRELPAGWRSVGEPASRAECLSRIEDLWANMGKPKPRRGAEGDSAS